MLTPLPINLLHPETAQDPYPVYRYYREYDPVHLFPGKTPRYVLSRYVDVVDALRNRRLGRHVRRGLWDESRMEIPPEHLVYTRTVREWVISKDLPEHRTLRQSINRILGDAIGGDFRGWVRAEAEALLAKIGPRVELMEEFASELTNRIVADLMDIRPYIAPERLGKLLNFLQIVFTSPFDPARITQASGNISELNALIQEALGRLGAEPARAAQLKSLAQEAQLGHLEPSQTLPTAIFLMMAARDNVRSTIGSAIYCLLRYGLWETVREDPALLPGVVRETYRFEPGVHFVSRHAMEDVEMAGVTVREGEGVTCALASANRDPNVFPDPDTFDIRREGANLASFGTGLHRCPGEKLANVIVEEALGAVLRAWPKPRLALPDVTPRWLTTVAFRNLESLPLDIER